MTTQLLKHTGTGALAGVTIGTLQSVAFSAINGPQYLPGVPDFLAGFANENTAVLVQLVVYALLGALCVLASAIYDVERLSIATATLTHVGLIGGGVFAAGWFLKWFSAHTALRFVVAFLLIYAALWAISWLYYSRTVKTVNARLRDR